MKEKADFREVDGWVRNNSDGSVEALLQGDEDGVMRVLEWSRVGPPDAVVTSVTEERKEPHPRQKGFRVSR